MYYVWGGPIEPHIVSTKHAGQKRKAKNEKRKRKEQNSRSQILVGWSPSIDRMAKLELIDEPKDNKSKNSIKRNHGSTKCFVFVDYFFLFMFLVFLCYIILKIAGFWFHLLLNSTLSQVILQIHFFLFFFFLKKKNPTLDLYWMLRLQWISIILKIPMFNLY